VKQVRLTNPNELELISLIKASKNDLLNISRAANIAVMYGMPMMWKVYVDSNKPRNRNGGAK